MFYPECEFELAAETICESNVEASPTASSSWRWVAPGVVVALTESKVLHTVDSDSRHAGWVLLGAGLLWR